MLIENLTAAVLIVWINSCLNFTKLFFFNKYQLCSIVTVFFPFDRYFCGFECGLEEYQMYEWVTTGREGGAGSQYLPWYLQLAGGGAKGCTVKFAESVDNRCRQCQRQYLAAVFTQNSSFKGWICSCPVSTHLVKLARVGSSPKPPESPSG